MAHGGVHGGDQANGDTEAGISSVRMECGTSEFADDDFPGWPEEKFPVDRLAHVTDVAGPVTADDIDAAGMTEAVVDDPGLRRGTHLFSNAWDRA